MTSNSSYTSVAGRNLLSCSSSSPPRSSIPCPLALPWVSAFLSFQLFDTQQNPAYKSWAKYQARKTNSKTRRIIPMVLNSSRAASSLRYRNPSPLPTPAISKIAFGDSSFMVPPPPTLPCHAFEHRSIIKISSSTSTASPRLMDQAHKC